MVTRREFMLQAITGLSAVACSPLLTNSVESKKINEIGLILGTVRKPLESDWLNTIEYVSSCGYKHIEFSRHFGDSKEVCKETLKRLGLKTYSGGGAMIDLENKLSEKIEFAHYFEQQYVVCYWPWSDSGKDKKIDDFKKLGAHLNKIGQQLKSEGLTLAYHNHDIEFLSTENKIPYDTILQYTNPDLVTMEIDLYWIRKGGGNPLDYFEKFPGRFQLCHVKDMDKTVEQGFACVGEGIIDFNNIFKKAETAGLKHFIVEHDKPEDPLECIKVSADHLRGLRI